MEPEDLAFAGQIVRWRGHGIFRATSGLPKYQLPQFQCLQDNGPVPEGAYVVKLVGAGAPARDDGTGSCSLQPSWQFESIPRLAATGDCEPYWRQWGWHRIRFEPADEKTRLRCRPRRSGFYLHDSTKGYSHGCIEIEGRFFAALRTVIASGRQKQLRLRVQYVPGRQTNGGTGRE
jgi:hypothetical protein